MRSWSIPWSWTKRWNDSSLTLDKFEYMPIGKASFSKLSQLNAEEGPSVPVPIYYSEDEIELVEAPIPISNLDEYDMVESENETDATKWEDYLILPDSPDSTLPRFRTIISSIVLPNDDDDQIVPSEPVVSPVVPSFTYPSFPDSPLTAIWWEYDAIRREDTLRTYMEAPVIPTPAQWKSYCYTCGETGHYPRMCCFYRPYGNSVIRCLLCDGIGHYASSCPKVIAGLSEGASRVLTFASANASTSTVIEVSLRENTYREKMKVGRRILDSGKETRNVAEKMYMRSTVNDLFGTTRYRYAADVCSTRERRVIDIRSVCGRRSNTSSPTFCTK
ncbi:Zinc finger CCHC-type [Arabidopsis thaliana x Arabidopsis arenosa]|uniref:Zinc finger CCHC-type n=1 Tax=Arabidopsis thaliana x Arabidopsis arenosa TaxID=1240361 RepID=A0A8T1YB02_9BRAS|nr:Zinc finger CCHC-type [Arabidopsis thaliana x Arabidopsis arenosa]